MKLVDYMRIALKYAGTAVHEKVLKLILML